MAERFPPIKGNLFDDQPGPRTGFEVPTEVSGARSNSDLIIPKFPATAADHLSGNVIGSGVYDATFSKPAEQSPASLFQAALAGEIPAVQARAAHHGDPYATTEPLPKPIAFPEPPETRTPALGKGATADPSDADAFLARLGLGDTHEEPDAAEEGVVRDGGDAEAPKVEEAEPAPQPEAPTKEGPASPAPVAPDEAPFTADTSFLVRRNPLRWSTHPPTPKQQSGGGAVAGQGASKGPEKEPQVHDWGTPSRQGLQIEYGPRTLHNTFGGVDEVKRK